MFWFLIYAIMSFLIYSFCYSYILDEYEESIIIAENKKYAIIAILSAFIGMIWPVLLGLIVIYLIIIYIKKLCPQEN